MMEVPSSWDTRALKTLSGVWSPCQRSRCDLRVVGRSQASRPSPLPLLERSCSLTSKVNGILWNQ